MFVNIFLTSSILSFNILSHGHESVYITKNKGSYDENIDILKDTAMDLN